MCSYGAKARHVTYMRCCTSLRKKKKNIEMYNCYGWIKLGVSRKHIDHNALDEEHQQTLIDKKEINLGEEVSNKIEELFKNDIGKYRYIGGMNNLDEFLSLQYSRNHGSSRIRDFYKWVAEISDGSHGILYEIDDEAKGFNPDKPYKVYRLIGSTFEECEETLINEKFKGLEY